MSEDATVDEAIRALTAPRLTIATAEQSPSLGSPGLYAVHALDPVWDELRLDRPPDDRPLYVGKSESNFQTRDLDEHFCDGRTGHSTVRRSLAALLHEKLNLEPAPRSDNPLSATKYASNFGLTPNSDVCLTAWMRSQLLVSLWPHNRVADLDCLETRVIGRLNPPLCLKKWKPNPWKRTRIDPARKLMSDMVRSHASAAVTETRTKP